MAVNLLPDTSIYRPPAASGGGPLLDMLRLLKLTDDASGGGAAAPVRTAAADLPSEITTGASAPRAVSGGPIPRTSTAEAANDAAYIRQAATARGIDPDVAVKIAASEGLFEYVGDLGSSFGPFQLHYGGMARGGNAVGGLGDEFTKQTGLHASDPSTKKAQIDFALDHASVNGWGPWHGWKGHPFAGISSTAKPLGMSSASTADVKASQTGSGQASAYAEENTRRAPGASKLDAAGNEIVSKTTRFKQGETGDPLVDEFAKPPAAAKPAFEQGGKDDPLMKEFEQPTAASASAEFGGPPAIPKQGPTKMQALYQALSPIPSTEQMGLIRRHPYLTGAGVAGVLGTLMAPQIIAPVAAAGWGLGKLGLKATNAYSLYEIANALHGGGSATDKAKSLLDLLHGAP